MPNSYFVYILCNKRNGTLYAGVTGDLIKEFGNIKRFSKGFTNKYQVHKLVYFEETSDIESAIKKEKQLKKWQRQWKLELIEAKNPNWKDLYNDLI